MSINRERFLLWRATPEKRTFNNTTRLAKLDTIYDGDTFTVVTRLNDNEPFYKYQLRLLNIDTPELKPLLIDPNRILHKEAGYVVRDILRDVLPLGCILMLDFKKEDKYGRLLADVWTTVTTWWGFGPLRRGWSVSKYLLDNNLAVPYNGQTKNEFTQSFLANILLSGAPLNRRRCAPTAPNL